MKLDNNLLLEADNIDGLQYLLQECNLAGKVDLVYIDPPFATNAVFKVSEGRTATISNSRAGEIAYSDKLKGADFVDYIKQTGYFAQGIAFCSRLDLFAYGL